ncbi:MAG TPA: type II toxin-antitoxin system VapC family toxin [Mycobacterium sp.]
MQIYIDTSALVKLVVVEAESAALRSYFEDFAHDTLFAAALARTELVRSVARLGSIEIIETARLVLTKLDLVMLNLALLDAAATIAPLELRTLDAIHLAAARTAPDLRALVTYDNRLAQAAAAAGIAVVSPR